MSIFTDKLLAFKDDEYGDFQVKLTPGTSRDFVIGVRVPNIRAIAKECINDENLSLFFDELPHKYYDENMLHAALISEIKDYDECIRRIDQFLPYVDNWAVCDTLLPKLFKKRKDTLLDKANEWMNSGEEFTVRYGIAIIMRYYLDKDFKKEYLDKPASIKSDKYYINMMIAWLFATALAKQWDSTISYLENNCFDVWVHNKTIQKARESFRITNEQKEYLKTLKR